jgi:chromosome segregation ATPase
MNLTIRLTLSITAVLSGYFLSTQAYAAGTIKCWKNAEKIRECGRVVPPEFAQGRIEILNSQGQVIKVYDRVLTKEERKEAKRIAKLKKAEERRKKESRKRDVILMMTFSTEKELTIAHQNKIEALQGILKLTQTNNDHLDEKLTAIQKQLANYERAGEKAPPRLYENMHTVKSKIQSNNKSMESKQLQIKDMNTQFESDLQRYKELKSYQRTSRLVDEDE